jgi:hypothetical protein
VLGVALLLAAIRSIARLLAVVVSQPPGLGGTPYSGHFSSGHQRLARRLLGDPRCIDPSVITGVSP